MQINKTLPLNIYSMFLVRDLYLKMTYEEWEKLLFEFDKLLCDNKPSEAQDLINKTLEIYEQ